MLMYLEVQIIQIKFLKYTRFESNAGIVPIAVEYIVKCEGVGLPGVNILKAFDLESLENGGVVLGTPRFSADISIIFTTRWEKVIAINPRVERD